METVVGRDRELDEIAAFLDAGANGRVLLLEGEAGIGKTTLWRAGVEAARALGFRTLDCTAARSEAQLAFTGVRDLLGEVFDEIVDELPEPQRRALAVALLRASPGETALDAGAIAFATLTALRAVASRCPTLVAVDDVQWLDAASAAAVSYVVRRLRDDGPALLFARRGGDGADELGLDRVEATRVESLVVAPLSIGALGRIIHGRLGVTFPRPTLIRVHGTSGGNPFFALELARALAGRELRPGDPLPVPATLAELMRSRFEQLGPDVEEVLLFVAALARPTVELVARAVGDRAASALETAAGAGVIEIDGSSVRFTHPLLASVHYDTRSSRDRARVHRRLAAVVSDPEERGRHLGAATSEPDAEIAAALDEAAAAARARGAPDAAAELAEVALRLTPVSDLASTLRRMRNAAEHQFAAGSTARARTLLEGALARAPRGRERAWVALELAKQLDSQDLAAERLLLARALLEAEGDATLRAKIHRSLADCLRSNLAESRRHAHVAFDLAERTGEAQVIAETLTDVVFRDFLAGAGMDHRLISRGIALEERLPQLAAERRPTEAYAFALMWSGDLERARPLYERLRAIARARGDTLGVLETLYYSIVHELNSEDWDEAARYADEGLTLAVEVERDVDVAFCLSGRVRIDAYRGDVERARRDAAEARRIFVAAGFPDRLFPDPSLGVLELSLGEPASALAHLRPAMEQKLANGSREPGFLTGFPEHVEAAVACGELEEASELLDFVEEHARRLDRAWALACCARGRALLADARGDETAAEAAFARAYEQHTRRPQQLATYELARTLLIHGSILRRRRQRRRAREALGQALAIFERLGARIYAERVRSELARIGGRAASPLELTPSEQRIAELVAEGKTNKEVAAILVLADRTVESALTQIYRKLDVRSRTELARKFAGSG